MDTIIGEGSRHEGKLTASKGVRIDGVFAGTLIAKETLTLGVTGDLIDVNAKVKNAVIGGKVKGTVAAEDKVTLEATAKVEGAVSSKLIVIKEGAEFFGTCEIGIDKNIINSNPPEIKAGLPPKDNSQVDKKH